MQEILHLRWSFKTRISFFYLFKLSIVNALSNLKCYVILFKNTLKVWRIAGSNSFLIEVALLQLVIIVIQVLILFSVNSYE